MAAGALLFGGDIYFERYLNGVLQGMKGPFSGAALTMQPQVDQKDKVSKGRNTYGQLKESVALQQPTQFGLTLDGGTAEELAIALMGSVSVLSQTSGSLAAVDVVAKLDTWVPLTKARLTGPATVTNSAASTTYVEDTHYEINRELGWFRALSGGTITEGQALKLSSTYGAISGSLIGGAAQPDLRIKLVLDGKNLVDNAPCVVTVDEAIVAPNAAVDFLNSDFVTMPLAGRMKTQAGKSSPFFVELRNAG